ncbi:hypothetical protein [Photobacterium leiognathi]|uniref:hypothetical protein n=1 Tax=Photobacterium leiognathi TaxID=553611 RepID=UPI0029823FCF|nr:hypothetical protein [Photobacterium leiognathi]
MYDYDEERRRRIEEQEQRREDERVARYWADREERDRDFYRQEERERKARERDLLEYDQERRNNLSNYHYGYSDDMDSSKFALLKIIIWFCICYFGAIYLLFY